jgi:hypothetical protein
MFKAQLNDPVDAGAGFFDDQKDVGLRQREHRKSSPYKYKDLNLSEVRLLTLLPGLFGTSIYVLFEVKTLTESSIPRYEALSYTWGPLDNPEDIYIGTSDDSVLSVTQNLACALQHLRYPDRPRTLWIDAICVDQSNLTERSSQVQRMADIYKLSEQVLVWLGPEGDNSSVALKFLHSLSTKVEVDRLIHELKPSDEAKSNGEAHWSDLSASLPYGAGELIPIHHLFQRFWFGRLWIRQEVRLAKRAIVICGFGTILWQNFRKAVYCLQKKVNASYHLVGISKQLFLDRCQMIYHLCADAGSQSIANLIDEARNCECSDPRDRIYGVLGMFAGGDRSLKIIPDFQKSIDQVYRDFFLSYLNHFEFSNLGLLASCEMQDHRSTTPSWVPDWSQKRMARPFQGFFVSGNSGAEVEYTGEGSIKVLGVKAATIKDVDQIHMHRSGHSDVVAAIRRCILPGVNTNGGELLEKYCRTFCANRFQDRYYPPMSSLASFNESKEVLRLFLEPQKDVNIGKSLDFATTKYSSSVLAYMENRSFISTEAGDVGLAPLLTKAGDEVVVIPGCSSPMVLRPADDGTYQVVGECFILGVMDGEALLGPLPDGYERITKLYEEHGCWYQAYRDWRADKIRWTDPRFDLFKSEMQENGIRRIFIRESESDAESVNGDCGVRMRTSHLLSEADEVLVVGVDLKPFELI